MDRVIDGATKATYLISVGLVGNWLTFINVYAPAIGVILGILTFIVSSICQIVKTRKYLERENDK